MELVIFIIIVSAASAGILLVMSATTQRSADPMVRQQALLIAESYLEEILHKRFTDPSAGTTQVCPTPEVGGRASYDNVCDYHNLNDNAGVIDQLGNAVTGLTAYNVSVTVTGTANDGTALNDINNTGALRVLRVDVEVTHDDISDFQVRLTGYRANYYCSSTDTALGQGCPPR